MQTSLISAIESLVNICIGMGVALASQYIVFPIVGIENVSHSVHIQITLWFTAISFFRSYMIRRWFSKKLNKVLVQWTQQLKR